MALKPYELSRLSAELPEYTLLHSYRAAVPVYECTLAIRVMTAQELSPLQYATLQCVGEGLDTPVSIDFVLGCTRGSARVALAALLSLDLIAPISGASIVEGGVQLTNDGAQVLAKSHLVRPEETNFRILYDGLLGTQSLPGRLRYITKQEAQRANLHILPYKMGEPELRDLDAGQVKSLFDQARKSGEGGVVEGEFHDLVGVERTLTFYRPCSIAAFDSPDRSQVSFRVLDRGVRLKRYESVLTAVFTRQPEVLPFAEHYDFEDEEPFPNLLDEELLEEAATVEEEVSRIRREAQVDATEVVTEAEVAVKREGPTTREQLVHEREQRADLEQKLQSLRLIDTYEHRPLLEEAFQKSKKRVIVISPWMRRDAVDGNLLRLIEQALDRGVEIVVGWGMPPREWEKQGTVEDERTQSVLRQLEGLKTQNQKRKLRVVRLGNTHEKVLIKDEEFVVVTSFNWLSFRGDPERGFRQETGYYHAIADKVRADAERVMARINEADPGWTPDAGGRESSEVAARPAEVSDWDLERLSRWTGKDIG